MAFPFAMMVAAWAAQQGANKAAADNQNRANMDLTQQNRDWQEYMSNTAHVREVNDLKAAGLNPVLSAGGNGSSTPSSSPASVQMPAVQMPDLFSMGMSLKALDQTDKKLEIEGKESAARIAKTLSEKDLNRMKKILMQKGMFRAELEGDAVGLMRRFLQWMKGAYNQNQPGTAMPEDGLPMEPNDMKPRFRPGMN